MEPYGFLALLGLTGALAIFSDDDDDAETGNGDDPVEGTKFDISESGSFSGTEGNDTVTISGDERGVSLDTGAGARYCRGN